MSGNGELWRMICELGLLFVAAAATSFALVLLSRPLLARYALARPNLRSSHKVPTPQGGGIVVVAVTVGTAALAISFVPAMIDGIWHLGWVFTIALLLAVVGAVDDVHVLEAIPRLVLQTIAVAAIIAALPPELRVVSILPWWIERGLLLVGGLWFVNLVNFMDGIDWMTVAEVIPITAGIAIFGLMGALPWPATIVSMALCGAIAGFAPFNRPVAQLFLGDVGSLPIGLLLGWLLILLAGSGHFAAALLLPLYYLADATITLLRRLIDGQKIMQAHRSHFYQRAMDRGFRVYQVIGHVFAVNLVLVGLAATTLLSTSQGLHVSLLTAGSIVVGTALWKFNRGYRHT